MGAAAIALSAVGTLLSVAGTVQQGEAAENQAKYQAAVAKNNQIIAQQKAADALQRGDIAERQHRLQVAQQIGAARAGAAGRGVVADIGSALSIQEDIAATGELDALTIRSNAEREAAAFSQQAREFGTQQELFKGAGQTAVQAANIQSAGTLVTGGSNVADKWHQFYGR